MANWLKLGGLYLRTSKEGKKYMAGYLGNVKLCIFKNDNKQEEKDFDYHIMLTERPPRKDGNGTQYSNKAPQAENPAPLEEDKTSS